MSQAARWRGYSSDEISSLSDWDIYEGDVREQRCPHCRNKSLRLYMYRARRTGDLATQIWCQICHSYSGWTGPYPSDLHIEDPLAGLSVEEFQEAVGKGEDNFFGRLDALWEKGLLPQRVTKM